MPCCSVNHGDSSGSDCQLYGLLLGSAQPGEFATGLALQLIEPGCKGVAVVSGLALYMI